MALTQTWEYISKISYLITTTLTKYQFSFRKFQSIMSTPNNSYLLSYQDTNWFWCKQKLNSKSLIQLLKALSVKLTETYNQISIIPMNHGSVCH